MHDMSKVLLCTRKRRDGMHRMRRRVRNEHGTHNLHHMRRRHVPRPQRHARLQRLSNEVLLFNRRNSMHSLSRRMGNKRGNCKRDVPAMLSGKVSILERLVHGVPSELVCPQRQHELRRLFIWLGHQRRSKRRKRAASIMYGVRGGEI